MSEATDAIFTAWGERVSKAVEAWQRWEMLPPWPRMDRVFKDSGVRDLVVENHGLREVVGYATHASWRCEYRTCYGECHCGLDELCDKLGIPRVPPNDPEAYL